MSKESVVPNGKEKNGCDYIEEAMGGIGKYQIMIFAAVSLVKIAVAWHQLSIIFLAPPQNYSCRVSDSSSLNNSSANYSDETEKCNTPCNSWEFDHSIFTQTIVDEWDLVCSKAVYVEWAQTVYMFGILTGNFIIGLFADWYGRKLPLIVSLVVQVIAGSATAFSPNYAVFITLRIVDAFATGGVIVTSFVLVMEFVGEKWRPLLSVAYHAPFSLGHATMPAVSHFFPNWRHFQLFISLPTVILFSYYWFLPESPRWLLTAGRLKEATDVVAKASKINGLNGRDVPGLMTQQLQAKAETVHKGNFLDLFRYPNLRMRTICLSCNWMACGMSFFGLAQYMGQVTGNIFINVMIGGLIAFPSVIMAPYLMTKIGRKGTLITSQAVVAASCFLLAFAPKDHGQIWPVLFSSTGILGASTSFPTVYLYSAELFPTVVRNIGVGFGSTCSRIASMIAPFILLLKVYGDFVPPFVFGIIPVLGLLFGLFLPETQNLVLPDTIADSELFKA